MEWVLVLYIYAGTWSNGDSVALTTIPMATAELCKKAADESNVLVKGSTKTARAVCWKVK
jgi:hypothetical protein